MSVHAVEFAKPFRSDDIAAELEALAERARNGEFSTVFIVGMRPDGAWMTREIGDCTLPSLMKIGMLESIKADVLEHSKAE
jgi:hypothetical protein